MYRTIVLHGQGGREVISQCVYATSKSDDLHFDHIYLEIYLRLY